VKGSTDQHVEAREGQHWLVRGGQHWLVRGGQHWLVRGRQHWLVRGGQHWLVRGRQHWLVRGQQRGYMPVLHSRGLGSCLNPPPTWMHFKQQTDPVLCSWFCESLLTTSPSNAQTHTSPCIRIVHLAAAVEAVDAMEGWIL
jgi:hypothetical protein